MTTRRKFSIASGCFAAAAVWAASLILMAAASETAASAEAAAAAASADPAASEARMAWWREARFGLFIHWGLYAIPAGTWKDQTNHAEWIRHTAQIPIEEYDKLVDQFNPVEFDADAWARMAADAGMKYIVITSKHHDGFCLFDSAYTGYDVMSTPFKRDIMKELAEACRRHGLKMCWYHSIMDWHHPDYLPRRGWENRSAEGADFDRYVAHLKNQIRELVTNYGEIGVLWFDGEWEGTWNHAHGRDLYDYVRSLQPSIIVNNRVDKGRAGMEGLTRSEEFGGDFGTPEQQIPATGLPGVDWETCMTMNENWGYNKHDDNWKSTESLIRRLADIASKGGNFLLNVGPTAEGLFPEPCVERLAAIGEWMRVNGESIYGTTASPFKSLDWGRCTVKALPGGRSRLYLHVFEWPAGGKLVVPGMDNEPIAARLLADPSEAALAFERRGLDVVISLPAQVPDPVDAVVVLDVAGGPVVVEPPAIEAFSRIFVDTCAIRLASDVKNAAIRYTLDGSEPIAASAAYDGPVRINSSATLKAALFRDGRQLSGVREARFEKAAPAAATVNGAGAQPGLRFEYFEGEWQRLPDFDALEPVAEGTCDDFDIDLKKREEHFGFRFSGYVNIPTGGVYRLYIASDDGSRLTLGNVVTIDNDGLHGAGEAGAEAALAAGLHPITVAFFECTGSQLLTVSIEGVDLPKRPLAAGELFCR